MNQSWKDVPPASFKLSRNRCHPFPCLTPQSSSARGAPTVIKGAISSTKPAQTKITAGFAPAGKRILAWKGVAAHRNYFSSFCSTVSSTPALTVPHACSAYVLDCRSHDFVPPKGNCVDL